MKLVDHIGLLIRLSEFESQCPYHIEAHSGLRSGRYQRSKNDATSECVSIW